MNDIFPSTFSSISPPPIICLVLLEFYGVFVLWNQKKATTLSGCYIDFYCFLALTWCNAFGCRFTIIFGGFFSLRSIIWQRWWQLDYLLARLYPTTEHISFSTRNLKQLFAVSWHSISAIYQSPPTLRSSRIKIESNLLFSIINCILSHCLAWRTMNWFVEL